MRETPDRMSPASAPRRACRRSGSGGTETAGHLLHIAGRFPQIHPIAFTSVFPCVRSVYKCLKTEKPYIFSILSYRNANCKFCPCTASGQMPKKPCEQVGFLSYKIDVFLLTFSTNWSIMSLYFEFRVCADSRIFRFVSRFRLTESRSFLRTEWNFAGFLS